MIDLLATLDAVGSWGVQPLMLGVLAVALLWLARNRPGNGGDTAEPLRLLGHVAAAALEVGDALVLPLGRGSLAGAQAADSLAALAIAGQAAGEAEGDVAPWRSCSQIAGDATLWLAAYRRQELACFAGPDSATYAAGVRSLLAEAPRAMAVPAGAFGDEFLLFAEPGAWYRPSQPPAAVATPTVLPYLLVTAADPAIGSELYEAGATLGTPHSRPSFPLLWRLQTILLLGILATALARLAQTW